MKKSILILTILTWLIIVNHTIAQQSNIDFEPGKLIIKTTQSLNLQTIGYTGISSIDSLNQLFGVTSIEQIFSSAGLDQQKLELYNQIGMGRIYVLTLPDTTDILNAMETYKNLTDIEYAEPNMYLRPLEVYPCDWFFQEGSQWGLHNLDGEILLGCKARADIKAPEAWQIEKGDTNLIVGIIDTGIRRRDDSIGELRNRVWVNYAERNGLPGVDDDYNGYTDDSIGWNFVDNTPFVEPESTIICPNRLHGTRIASIIGSETDSTNYCMDMAGINWKCKLMNLKVDYCIWEDDYCDNVFSEQAVAEAIWYATNMGAKVLNLSFGGIIIKTQMLPDSFRIIEDALTFAYNSGVVSIAAMGNGEELLLPGWWKLAYYPAFSTKTLAVGATDCEDNRVIHFDEPPYWQSSYGNHLDLVAPGHDIVTLYSSSGLFAGTSASTPFVVGIASLVITHKKKLIPNEVLTAEQIYEVLRHTADDTVGHTYNQWGEFEDTLCWDKFYGWGRANAFKALVAVSHGDVNNDSQIDVNDITYLINYLFKGGPPPVPVMDMADANCNKKVSIADTVYLINYLFKGGSAPSLCYTDCSQP
jgi:subtilisin family serine protease